MGYMMQEHDVVRAMLLRIGREVPGTAPLAKAVLGWARPHADWLLGKRDAKARLGWQTLRSGLASAMVREDETPCAIGIAAQVAKALGFDEADTRILMAAVAFERCGRARAVARLMLDQEADLSAVLADVAGVEPHALRRSQPIRLGLVRTIARRGGGVEVEIGWALDKLLDRGECQSDELLEALVGPRQTPSLALEDFVAHEAEAALLVRLLRGALERGAVGVNIVLHGPPGTGKTELARTLAHAAGAMLHGVGEADDEGDEPTRWERVTALKLAQRMLGSHGGAVLLFDEMEDMIGDAAPAPDGRIKGRQGSKLWVNRLLETNPVPVIWTTNALDNVDAAILRRMSFVLKLDRPSQRAARQLAERVSRDEGVVLSPQVHALVEAAPEAASVLRVAARAGVLAGEGGDVVRVAKSLVTALRGDRPVSPDHGPVDLALFESDRDIEALFARITAPGAPADVSLLLTGPPGTGKTGLAHRLAADLDRPLLVRRASDLLSKWVGETEAKIAASFVEAERDGAVLLFDEVDSLLFDRSTAGNSWEVTQVNELLTWLDRHPLPFVAATNHAGRLDPAALRRFVFKLELGALGPARARVAFARFFGVPAPAALAEINGLTPGDFAVVKRPAPALWYRYQERYRRRMG
ncbi:MAG: AAA family ATPase [Sphingomonadales bacterium]|nr:MAG: AAA family ATPase [Sphingomonadales bacterium]